MLDYLPDAVYISLITVLAIMCWRQHFRYLRRAVESAQEQADLHRKLAEANIELTNAAFDGEHDDLAKKRLELADVHTEASQTLTRHAAEIAALASSPLARWKRHRT